MFEQVQGLGEYYSEYQHHLSVRKEYARLKVYLYNLENEIYRPDMTENKDEFVKAEKRILELA